MKKKLKGMIIIKKILSIVFIFYLTVLNSEAAFVKNVDGLKISKEEIKLESFLNKKYRLYKYTLKNKGDYVFTFDLNAFDAEWIYKSARDIYRRDKFPYACGHMARATGETVGAGVSAMLSVLLFPTALTSESIFDIYAFENVPLGDEIPKTYIINPVKSILFLPYDLHKNPKEIQKAKDEVAEIETLFENKGKRIEIKPGETFEFYDILPIEGISGKSERWFNLLEYKDGHSYTEGFMY